VTSGPTAERPTSSVRWRSSSASRNGRRARSCSRWGGRRSWWPRPSRTSLRAGSAGRARGGSPASTRCCRARPPSARSARSTRAAPAGGRRRSSG
jgi:hypothetical protein